MTQMINIPGAESPLFQALSGLSQGFSNWKSITDQQELEKKKKQAQNPDYLGFQDYAFLKSLGNDALLQEMSPGGGKMAPSVGISDPYAELYKSLFGMF